jgi:hypothetical protein
VAALLGEDGSSVEVKAGGWGEIRVSAGGRDLYKKRFAKPDAEEIVAQVRKALGTAP